MAGITEYIEPLLKGQSLSLEQAEQLLDIIFEGEISEVQIAAFLTAMRIKGATAAELAGLAKSLRQHAVKVEVDIDNLIDTCGTGGGAVKTCNVSTASAIVAAGAGVYVAKHGNRGITSKCGSADVLEALGVKIDAGAETVAECIKQAHIGFMFAPAFHPAMKYVQPIRKSLGFRTAFNILGPLTNPAGVQRQVLGVADESLMETIAEALKLLGTKVAMVVHSNGMDEISTMGTTRIIKLNEGKIESYEINAEDFGIPPADINDLKVTDAKASAKVLKDILSDEESGPRRDIVILNAAAAIIVAGLATDFESAIRQADVSVSNGRALACLENLIDVSNSKW
ncbi:MAG: anthranilate phosphoribosyltransferase [Phycisphaerae bacterium]|nr:anthranilate phosphoribosyltransferase [Phycisphaerae bacterium]